MAAAGWGVRGVEWVGGSGGDGIRGVVRRLLLGLVFVAGIVLAAILLVTRIPAGQEWLVERGVEALNSRLNGRLAVEGVSSPDLLRGGTFRGVRVEGPDGRPLLVADSARASYRVWALVGGWIVFENVEVWGPEVDVERLPGAPGWNVVRLLEGDGDAGAPDDDDGGGGGLVALRGVALHDASVTVRTPAGASDTAGPLLEPAPDGEGRVRLYRFRGIDASLPEAVIRSPLFDGQRIRIADLSLRARVVREPLILEGLSGELSIDSAGLRLDASELRLPGTRASAEVRVPSAGDGPVVAGRVRASTLSLRDLAWLDPRLPEGGGSVELRFEWGVDATRLELVDADLRAGESRIRGELRVTLGPELRFGETDLRFDPLELGLVERFLPDTLPLDGRLRGRLGLRGVRSALAIDADLSLSPGGRRLGPSRIAVEGTLHLERPFGATDLRVRADSLDAALLAALSPEIRHRGPGSFRLDADGRLDGELRFDAGFSHTPPDLPASRIAARGTAWRRGGDVVVSVRGRLRPLSLTALSAYHGSLPVRGELRGDLRLSGELRDLEVEGTLESPGGPVTVATRLDITRPARSYRIDGTLDRFALEPVFPGLPPTALTGSFAVEGSGTGPDSVEATAEIRLGGSHVSGMPLDSVFASARVSGGSLRLDTLVVRSGGGDADGGGDFALTGEGPSGELRLRVATDSLSGLRPLFFSDTLVMADTLSALERQALEVEGVNPDTLPLLETTALAGSARGDLTFAGGLGDFTVEGVVEVDGASYGPDSIARGTVRGRIEGLPALDGPAELSAEVEDARVRGRSFAGLSLRGSFTRPRGEVEVEVTRTREEDYRFRAGVRVDSTGNAVALRELGLRFGDVRWSLTTPAEIGWRRDGLRVSSFRLERSGATGGEPMHITADGTLPSAGTADFHLEVDGLDLARVGRLLQREDDAVRGVVSLQVDVTGQARDPRIEGSFEGRGVGYGDVEFSRVAGSAGYRTRALEGRVEFFRDGRRVMLGEGTFPVDLALGEVEERVLEEPLALILRADSLPAASVMARFGAFRDVQGTVSGEVRVEGRPGSLRYAGEVRMGGGALTLPALGVRHDDVEVTLTLAAARTLEVQARSRARGSIVIEGTVGLDELADPEFDLRIRARDFLAVDRRDVTARVGGNVDLTGSYRRPVVGGSLGVESGVLRLEEFRRSADVVDLSDPAFFDVVDTALVADRSLLPESQSPFLRNLRVDVELDVGRDTWLRSDDMNVEIAGELSVIYDRVERNIVLEGRLRAARGSYTAFGRRFQVQEGGVEFVGTPGINPNLNIRTVHHLRTTEGEPLNIYAVVQGTLRNPRLTLESDAQPPISQSDLVSYLILGRPGFGLASEEGSSLGSLATRAVGSTAAGYLTSQLESVVAREFGLDYLAISPNRGTPGATQGALGGILGGTQIEIGQYLAPDLFLVVVYQLSSLNQSALPGARIEWRFADLWTGEIFFEDRFSRERLAGFGELGFRLEKVPGFFIFREWGY